MSFTLVRQRLLLGGRALAKTQGAPVRSYIPVAGPPRYPMSPAQRLILGVGPLLIMMIIPYWTLFNLPRWSRIRQGLPADEEEPEENEEVKEKKNN